VTYRTHHSSGGSSLHQRYFDVVFCCTGQCVAFRSRGTERFFALSRSLLPTIGGAIIILFQWRVSA
jgi:hypothetical protein